jgi:predicted ATPase
VAVLVTGMSGTGKSAALAELARRGHRVVDTDYGGWIDEVSSLNGRGSEPLWREERIDALLGLMEEGRQDGARRDFLKPDYVGTAASV